MIELLTTTVSAVELEFQPIALPALLVANLILLIILLLHGSGCWTIPSLTRRQSAGPEPDPTSPPSTESSSDAPPAEPLFPGIDPADHATLAEQDVFLDRLAALPQMRRLPDGTLIDWTTGHLLTRCECWASDTAPHLQWKRLSSRGLGMITRTGLAHYLAYQEGIARQLVIESVPSQGAMTDHSVCGTDAESASSTSTQES